MLYDYNGVLIINTKYTTFSENMVLDYAFDEETNANYTIMRIFKTKKDGTNQYPFVKYENPFCYASKVVEEGWQLVINAGLGWDNAIDGIAIENGVIKNNNPAVHHAGAIPLIIDENGDLGKVAASATAEDALQAGAVFATCGFCPIIENYQDSVIPIVDNVTHFTDNAQRMIIGQFGNGDYGILVCAGRSYDHSDGWTITEAQSICKKLGFKFAYNLDGGTSTAAYIANHPIYDYMEGTNRKVPSFIVFNGTNNFEL